MKKTYFRRMLASASAFGVMLCLMACGQNNGVKVTFVNTATNAESSHYYTSGEEVTLPETYGDDNFSLNSWYSTSDCSGAAITKISPTEDTKVYGKMDIKFSDASWIDSTTGQKTGRYGLTFTLDELKSLSNTTVTGFTAGYQLKKNDAVKLTFTGKSKCTFDGKMFFQIIDDQNSSESSCVTLSDGGAVESGETKTYTITTPIFQEKFISTNPNIAIGYGYSELNDQENVFSDWEIKIELMEYTLSYTLSETDATGSSFTTLPEGSACTLVTDMDYSKVTPVSVSGASAKLAEFAGEDCIMVTKNENNEIRVMWLFDTPVSAGNLSTLSLSFAGINVENLPQYANFGLIYDDNTVVADHGSALWAVNSNSYKFTENTIDLKTQECAWGGSLNADKNILGIQIWCTGSLYDALFVKDIILK